MSHRKPTKVLIYSHLVVLLGNVGVALGYFAQSRWVVGWIWTGCSAGWAVATALQAMAYRNRMETYRIRQRLQVPFARQFGDGR